MYKSLIITVVTVAAVVFSAVSGAQGIEAPKKVADNRWVMGVPVEHDITEFAAQGGDIIISLLSVEEMQGSKEITWSSANDIAFYQVPVDGAQGVTFANARALDRLLLKHADKNILVHCASANRVGALFALRAAWLDGLPAEQALAVGREHGMTSLENQVSQMLAE